METQEQSRKQFNCKNCKNKQSLIHKYQNLIQLLKKKADRTHLSMTQKISIGDRTTSNSSIYHFLKIQKHKLIMTLHQIFLKRKNLIFDELKLNYSLDQCRKATKFFIILSNLQKKRYFQSFNRIKELDKTINYQTQGIINQLGYEAQKDIQNNQFATTPLSLTKSINLNHEFAFHQLIKSMIFKTDQKKTSEYFKSLTNILLPNNNQKDKMIQQKQESNLKNQSHIQNYSQKSYNNQNDSGTLTLFTKSKQSFNIKFLYQKIFFLEQENQLYQEKIKKLKKQIQDANIRQEKQNKKKKQSLEMLAEDLAEKNEIITQLQENIAILQQKYEHFGNVILEDELTSLRKQVDKFQKLNQKLDTQSTKTKVRIAEVEMELKNKNQVIFKLQQELRRTKQNNFQLHEKNEELQKIQNNSKKLHKTLLQSLQKFKNFQKKFLSASKKSKFEQMLSIQKQEKEQQESYKVQLILIYLYNIQDQSYNFPYQNLFSQEQFEVLKQLKKKYLALSSQALFEKDKINQECQNKFLMKKISNFNHHGKSHQHVQNEEEVYCHENMGMDGTIFSVLNTPRDHFSGFNLSPNANNSLKSDLQMRSKQSSRQSPQKNLTMKLLQMQLQKNQQIQKISELKQKMMHIRNVILNLLKSLQIKVIKAQTQGILDVLFDVFQYSQEEKQQIFKVNKQRQRGIFGFFN